MTFLDGQKRGSPILAERANAAAIDDALHFRETTAVLSMELIGSRISSVYISNVSLYADQCYTKIGHQLAKLFV